MSRMLRQTLNCLLMFQDATPFTRDARSPLRPGTRAVDKVRLAVHRRVPTFASSLRELELATKRSEAKTAEKDRS